MSQSYPPEKAGQPGSQALPQRSTTLSSTTTKAGYISDDDAVPDYDTTDTIGVLTERLQAWKHACGYLENYMQAAEKMAKAQSKEYDKMLKSISDPLREGHHFDQSVGGVASLFENLRSNTQGVSNSHLEASKHIGGTVLPILERLHSEIKSKNKEIEGGAGKASKAVASARNNSQKHIEMLGQYSSIFESANNKIDAQHDPYVLHRGTQHRLHKQVLEENNSRQDFISVQKSFEMFESHVIRTIQQAFQSFQQVMGAELDRQKAMYGDMVANAQHIPPDFEWTRFVQRSGAMLIDPNAPPREVQNIQYPNENHAATKPLIQGTLERKGRGVGAITGYKTGFYAITPAKYLHEFDSDDNFRKDPSPELSLYLPDCTVGAVSDTKFNIKGKDVSKGKVGTAFQMNHELAFKAHTAADAKEWHHIIVQCIGSSTNETPTSTVTSPASVVTSPTSHVEEAKQPAPIKTDVPPPVTASGTPATAGATPATKTPVTVGTTEAVASPSAGLSSHPPPVAPDAAAAADTKPAPHAL